MATAPDLPFMPATELASRIRRGDLSPVTVVETFLSRIEDRNDDLNAYVTVVAEEARERAREAERAIDRGELVGPLHGVPVALKDLHGYKKGVRHTYCSVPFSDHVADHDATSVSRLEAAGAIVLGKTNAPEFGPKGTTDNLLFGPTGNPFDPAYNAGGSSGGSAAAVADGMATVAQGSDGGGSLRIPASWSGLYTIKPTFRRVAISETPSAFSHTPFIHHGPLARSVEDAALMLDVMAGSDSRDPHSVPTASTYLDATRRGIEGIEIAYTPDYGTFPVDPDVRRVVEDALSVFQDAGATVSDRDPALGHDHATLTDVWLTYSGVGHATRWQTLKETEGMDLLADHRYEITDELARMIDIGREVSAVEYRRLNHVRTDVLRAFADVLEEADLLVAPTVACPPVRNADDGHTVGPSTIEGEAVDPQIGWCMTYLQNFTGHPAASVPVGRTDDGLPVGLQIMGPRFGEEVILAASEALERHRPWADTYPSR